MYAKRLHSTRFENERMAFSTFAWKRKFIEIADNTMYTRQKFFAVVNFPLWRRRRRNHFVFIQIDVDLFFVFFSSGAKLFEYNKNENNNQINWNKFLPIFKFHQISVKRRKIYFHIHFQLILLVLYSRCASGTLSTLLMLLLPCFSV